MTSEHALLNAIKEDPDDDTRRLVLADWLEENGQPERAELIRVQVELAAIHATNPHRTAERQWELEQRQQKLLNRYGSSLVGPVPGSGSWMGVSAGHAALGHSSDASCGEIGGELEGDGYRFGGLALGGRTGLELFRLWGRAFGAALEILTIISRRGTLTSLHLNDNRIALSGSEVLAASSHLVQLTSLNLRNNRIGALGTKALAASPYLARLTSLHLTNNGIGEAGAKALASSPHLTQLKFLYVERNEIGVEGEAALRERFGSGIRV